MYGLLQVMGSASKWVRIAGIVAAFGIVQLAISIKIGNQPILNNFDTGLLFQGATMAMVALGLNLIYGFNGQFSLGQYGFYGLGAYAAAYVTYKWTNEKTASALLVLLLFVILAGAVILGLRRFLKRYTALPVLSAFTLYLIGVIVAGAVAVVAGQCPGLGRATPVRHQGGAGHPRQRRRASGCLRRGGASAPAPSPPWSASCSACPC